MKTEFTGAKRATAGAGAYSDKSAALIPAQAAPSTAHIKTAQVMEVGMAAGFIVEMLSDPAIQEMIWRLLEAIGIVAAINFLKKHGGAIKDGITDYFDFVEDTVGAGVSLSDPYVSIDEYQRFAAAQSIGDIAGKYGNTECVDAKKAMVEELEKRNEKYEIIEIKYPTDPGTVISFTLEALYEIDDERTQISTNGYHVGVLYNGLVHCNVHPLGLPIAAWLNDFLGIGVVKVMPEKYQALKKY